MMSGNNKFLKSFIHQDKNHMDGDYFWHHIDFLIKGYGEVVDVKHDRESSPKRFTEKIKSSNSVKVDGESIVNLLRMKDKESRINRKKEWIKNFSYLYSCVNDDFISKEGMAETLINNKMDELFSYKIQEAILHFLGNFNSRFNAISKKDACENVKYSLVNLISKYKEIEQALNEDISISVDGMSGCLSVDIIGKPIGLNYSVNLNLKFLANGSVSFACHDSDSKDYSYINGVVTMYDSYMAGHKFKSIVDLVKQGE